MIKSKSYSNKNKIKNMTFIGLFCAMAFVCVVLLNFKVNFLTFDLKDAVMTICGMFFGPLAGLFGGGDNGDRGVDSRSLPVYRQACIAHLPPSSNAEVFPYSGYH